MSITKRVFGRNAQGETVTQYILTNAMGAAILAHRALEQEGEA